MSRKTKDQRANAGLKVGLGSLQLFDLRDYDTVRVVLECSQSQAESVGEPLSQTGAFQKGNRGDQREIHNYLR